MNYNATAYITANHRGHGTYAFTATIADIDCEHAAENGRINAKYDTSGLTQRALSAWEEFVADTAEEEVAFAT